MGGGEVCLAALTPDADNLQFERNAHSTSLHPLSRLLPVQDDQKPTLSFM